MNRLPDLAPDPQALPICSREQTVRIDVTLTLRLSPAATVPEFRDVDTKLPVPPPNEVKFKVPSPEFIIVSGWCFSFSSDKINAERRW